MENIARHWCIADCAARGSIWVYCTLAQRWPLTITSKMPSPRFIDFCKTERRGRPWWKALHCGLGELRLRVSRPPLQGRNLLPIPAARPVQRIRGARLGATFPPAWPGLAILTTPATYLTTTPPDKGVAANLLSALFERTPCVRAWVQAVSSSVGWTRHS